MKALSKRMQAVLHVDVHVGYTGGNTMLNGFCRRFSSLSQRVRKGSLCLVVALSLPLAPAASASAQVTNWTSFTSFSQSGPQEHLSGTSGRQGVGSVVMNNLLWVAFNSGDSIPSDSLRVTFTNTGIGFGLSTGAQVIVNGSAVTSFNNPSLTSDGQFLYLGYTDTNGIFQLLRSSQNPGFNGVLTWTSLGQFAPNGGSFINSPSLAVLTIGITQYVMISETGTDRSLWLGKMQTGGSLSGATWTNTLGANIGMAPGLGVFNNTLYIAFPTNDNSHALFYYTTTDGVTVSSINTNASGDQSSTSAAMLGFQGHLYMAFRTNDGDHKFIYKSSTDGINWTGSRSLSGVTMGGPPALADGSTLTSDPGHLIADFVANDSTLYLYGGESQ
jgi:hypothetical protein